MFIEMHDLERGGRAFMVSLGAPAFSIAHGEKGEAALCYDQSLKELVDSYSAIRSALLKAGLLVVVEEEVKATKPPLEYPPASAVIDLSKTTIEGLCQAYAMWHGYPITGHPHDMRDSVIAELQRRINTKPLCADPNPTPLDDEAIKKAHVTGLCERYANWNSALYEAFETKNNARYEECNRQLHRILLELQRRIDANPEQVVRLRVDKTNDGWFVSDGVVIVASRAHTKEAAKEIAKELVRRFAGPNVRIEWENET